MNIERLELRISAGALRPGERGPTGLEALGRAVGAQLAARIQAVPLEGTVPRRMEVSVSGGAAPRNIAAAIDRRMRAAPAAIHKKGG